MIKPSPALWIVVGLVLAALEMVVPGFVVLWFGVAGIVTGILAFFIKNVYAQLGIFIGLSGILVVASQVISRRITKPEPEPVGANRLVGVEGVVLRAIAPAEMGRVKVLGEEWRAEAKMAIETGARVKIVEVEGTHLVVEPVGQSPAGPTQGAAERS
jgi:membrane protein implicated in regulation of membrane protease activity